MKKTKKTLTKSDNAFPVVGIGASAGGLDAFKQLLKAIPESSGMAYVLVQHLDPSHESLLQELLQKTTPIPVLEVTDDTKVAPDHIYIIPSNRMMIANDGVLELSPRPAKNKNERNMPIDLFFRSLAEVHQSHSIGVVLSGTATDGTLGLKAIKDHGGITFAQDEASAAYSGMPHNAVQAGVVDFVLPPGDIPKKLLEVANIVNGNGTENSGQKEEDAIFKQIFSLLRVRKGTDFTYYKQTTIRRRILRRMAITRAGEPAAYLKQLRRDKQEQDVLYMDLLIPVTDFFRDPETFDKLNTTVFPRIVENKTSGGATRAWVAGCSTGGKTKKDEKDLRIQQLERELAQTREDMRSITEEQEAANEELQSANEELLSGSEELQSLNEEMETSKEELQSTNEELMVVHQETVGLNEELIAARDYAEGIVDTVHEPLVVLDGNLRVKSANKAYFKTFEVNEKDTEDKLIFQLGNKQWDIPALRTLLEDVLPNKSAFENFEVARNFPNIGERTMRLNGRELKRGKEEEKSILLAIEDVTERARLRQKEKELLDRFEKLLLQAPVAIMVLKGPNYVVELANDAYLGIVEKDTDFIGRPLFESLPELEPQGIRELLDGVIGSGVPCHGNELKVMMLRKEKREKGYYNFVYHPIHDDQNEATGIMVVATEVTEQVLARKRVEENEFRYHNMIHTSPSLISILKGENMVIEIANDAILESWGKGKDIVGKSLFEALPEAAEQGFDKLLLSVYRTGEPVYAYEAPTTWVRKGKPKLEYYTFVYQAQRDLQGEIEGVAIIANEVTPQAILHKKLRESESHFRQMADLMPAKISNADIAGKVIYFNQNWLDFTGLDFEELKELGYHKIMHPEEMEEFGERLQSALETGTDLEMEMRFMNKDGDYVWHLNIASPITDENGNFKMWIGVTTDITEQIRTRKSNLETYKKHSDELEEQVAQRTVELKEANNELLERNEELKRLNKELEAFTYVASHDLQEPLRKIQTFVGRISDGEGQGLTEKGKGYFQRVYEVSEQMRKLIEDLLDFSRLGSAERKFVKTDLGKITGDVIKEFKTAIDAQKATITFDEMPKVKVIPFQFRQLIQNLIGNALKFSRPDTPPHIAIESKIAKGNQLHNKELAPDKKYCRITVEDNGIGFKPEYGDQIFEVFKRLHGKDAYQGTGIGLATVKRIVENHNGRITVDSELDRGARFDIYIPVL